MPKGRNAAKAFTESRSARFAESRRKSEAQKEAERKAGTRRTTMLVDADDVRPDDLVAVRSGGFFTPAEVDRDQYVVDGKAFVQRFTRED